MTREIVLVAAAEDMDDATFAKHMTLRHADSLGGLPGLTFGVLASHGLTSAWRAFHRQLHRVRVDLDHEHEGGQP